MLSRSGKLLLDLLYPPRCPVCGDVAPLGEELCPECRSRLPYVKEPACRKCGKPVDPQEVFCRDCMEHPHAYACGRGIFVYNDVMRETISYFKYKGRREYGPILGGWMEQAARRELSIWRPDLIIPVPLHPSRLRTRGYNQAELLASEIARRTPARLLPDGLMRTGKTAAMKNLSAVDRQKNLRQAFQTGPGFIPAPRALLVDDIYTTGATIDACAEILLEGGVQEVYFLTLAIGVVHGEGSCETGPMPEGQGS